MGWRCWFLLLALSTACVWAEPGVARANQGVWLVEGWEALSPSDRSKARQKYEIFKKMPRDRQREVEQNYQRWRQMGPSEQERIRRNYNLYRDLTPQQRRAVGERYRDLERAP